MLRLFVGLELPSKLQFGLEQICCGLKEARWVDPHNMHITLSFIGDINEREGEDLHKALSSVTFEAFELSLAGIDCFAHKHQPSSIWAGVAGDVAMLHNLQQKIVTALMRAGLEPEKRKYKPHVTLARLKKAPSEAALSFMQAHNHLKTESFPVSHFTLFRSHLSQNGADYQVLERYPA